MICICDNYPKCDTYVVYPENEVVGLPANKEIRRLRGITHKFFDLLWKTGIFANRTQAYKWLAKEMQVSHNICHIRCFDEGRCIDTILLSAQHILKNFGSIKTFEYLNQAEMKNLRRILTVSCLNDISFKKLICLVFKWQPNKIIKVDEQNSQVHLLDDTMEVIKISFNNKGNIVNKIKSFAHNYCYR